MTWLFGDPRVFNYLILALFALNAIWWGLHGKGGDALYWASAFTLNLAITFGHVGQQ